MKNKFLKNRSSYGRIFGASILALFMLVSTVFGLVLTSSETIEAEPNCDCYDFGDAPDPYPTLHADGGAYHLNGTGYYLGTSIDNESDGQPSFEANGDDVAGIDDEDGVILTSFTQGHMAKITVTTNVPVGAGNGNLSAWVDFNRDGDWEDAGEQILSDVSLGNATYEHWFLIPCSAEVGNTYVRVRFSTASELSFDGFAPDGEVEDYKIYIWPDDQYPSQSFEFGSPKTMREWRGNDYYVIGSTTPFWINSSDMCPGTERLEIRAWRAINLQHVPIQWTIIWEKIVYDGDPDDLDETYGSIVTKNFIDETCFHEVRYECWDYDNVTEGRFSIDFFVDKCGPNTSKTVGCPIYGLWLLPPWISGVTPLNFNSVDQCCLPNGTAVKKITIKVWYKHNTCDSSGALNVIDSIIVYDGDENDNNPAEGRIGYEFHFEQTGFYELEWWGEDMMGNKEAHHKQQHRVDVDPPEITKTYPEDGYCEVDEHEGFIKCCKPINLTVEEIPTDTCNAGLYGMFWRYEWNETYYPAAEEEGAVNGEDIVEELCIEDPDISLYWWYPYDEDIHFMDECVHDLYYFAIDNVGNYDEVHHQIYYVDNTPPIAIKEIGEPKCENELENDAWCVRENTPIWINVTDDGTEPCIVGSLHLFYRIWYDGEWENHDLFIPDGTLSEEIHLEGECMHYLEFYVEDCVGNRWPAEGYHNETFYVDETPPILTKTVGIPNCRFPESDDYCVNLSTLITLEAEEAGCCQNDSVTLEYRIWKEVGEIWSDWIPYEGPFNFTEECSHHLQVRASDCLGNEVIHGENFYVDETPPEILKSIGDPKCEVPGTDDWCVTTSTLISLDVVDFDCCQYGDVTIEYMIDDGDWEEYSGPFSFAEECEHVLTVRVYDCLGNGIQEEYWDVETFYVDDSVPVITKTVGEPKCDVPDSDDWCVTTDTFITLSAVDEGCCQNTTVTIEYRINGGDWQIYTEPFNFTEECVHELTVMAYDCLGNGKDDAYWHTETFYVDDSAPEIIKDVGFPRCIWAPIGWCVRTSSFITLSAEDEGCCPNSDITIEYMINEGDWQPYTEPFNFTEECEHILKVRAYDCLGNGMDEMYWDVETFYVDEKAPLLTKTVGEPKCDVPGTDDWCVTTDTLITLSAVNDGCCPSEIIYIDYKIDEGDWQEYIGPFSFFEECEHTLYVRVYDCLGNGYFDWDVETFYVDDSVPVITKTVGEPNCEVLDPADTWCVSTDTLITLSAVDEGCCPNTTVNIEYRINVGDWQIYTEPFNFTEECVHELTVMAYDCLGNGIEEKYWDIETFYVDDSAPVITKTVGEPKCEVPGTDDWCVTTNTLITLEAVDEDCCPNNYLNIEYKINDGDWKQYLAPFTFNEECMHNFTVRAYDCLGNGMDEMYWDVETFYVDDSVPVITKTVGEPKCDILDSDDWCVSTDTLITLSAVDEGCCPNTTVNIEYRINVGDWQIYTEPFNFTEECVHELTVRAYDCLGNGKDDAYWHTETFYVDDSAPEITKTVGEPKCEVPGTDDWCVTTNTLITLEAVDEDCCPNSDINIEYKINDGDWQPYTEPFNFAEECEHVLTVRAYDCLGNGMDEMYWDVETFYVDETDPVIVKTVGEPNCVIEEGFLYCVNTSTIITIDAYDDGCCNSLTVWYSINDTEPIEITELLPFSLTFEEECMHELEIWAYDCLGHQDYDWEIFYVDEQAPELEKEVGDPHVYLGLDDYKHDVWLIYPETDICFEAIEQGCCQSGESFIYYRYWYLGSWTDWMLYEGCINLELGCVHYLEAYAVDCLGNAGEIDNETFWVCGPGGGDGDPNIEIIFPEHGSTQKTDFVEVILHAYDDDTAWEDLGVYLWIPGGRRDAPYLYYEVYPLDEENQTYISYVPIYWYQDGAQITLEALALDEDGNTGFALPVTFKVDTTIVWDQWMQYGWNPLPLSGGMPPDFGCNESIESVMNSVNGSYDWVFHYDLDEGWISYYIDREINELTTIEGGKNYWVHIFNESGLRYYIGVGEIEILYPLDGAVLFDLNEINGTTWNSETGMEEVHVQIYYKDESNVKHYWDGSAWGLDDVYLPCDLGAGYIQDWTFNSAGVSWIPGETFYVKARAMDKFGCYAFDMVSFEFEECICAPSIDLEKQVWMGEGWTNETEVFVGEEARFNLSINNNGETIGGKGGGGSGELPINETVLAAIEDGIAWLITQQNGDGSWGTSDIPARTGFVLIKLQDYAYEIGYSPFDPSYEYYTNVIDGWEYLLNNCQSEDIPVQTNGDPDFNGNGYGLYWNPGSHEVYSTGICSMALSASGAPDRENEAGIDFNSDGDPDTYAEISQDVAEWLAFAQSDSGNARGGWYYSALNNQGGGDNSISGYAVLGLASAEEFGSTIPSFVKTEINLFINYIQCDTPGSSYGGSGYTSGCYWVNMLKTGNLLFEMTFYGDDAGDSRFADALDYIENHWHDENYAPGWGYNQGSPAHYQAMYCLMKGLEYSGIDFIDLDGDDTPEHDWYSEFAEILVSHQNPSGYWPSSPAYVWDGGSWGTMSGDLLSTVWVLLTLEKIAPQIVTDCPPCNLTEWYINDTLPEGLEYVINSTKIVVVSCDGYFESSGPEVQPEITYNPDGTTTLEWEETGEEPFELSLCTTMYIYFNATVLDCEAPDGHLNMAYVEAYSPDDDSWVSDDGMAIVWGDCRLVD